MGFIDLFPTVVYTEDIKNSYDISSYVNFINNTKIIQAHENKSYGYVTENSNVLNENIFSNLKQFILKKGLIYLKELGHIVEDLQISNSWGNILDKEQLIGSHLHTNSYISGVLYLTNSSSIRFKNPLITKDHFTPSRLSDPNNFRSNIDWVITPTPGLILLFPSWLEHGANPSETDNRISIAFNIIPKGKFGFPTAELNL